MNAGMTTMRQFAEINAAADNWRRNPSVISLVNFKRSVDAFLDGKKDVWT